MKPRQVYIIASGDGLFKVGFSIDPARRIRDLQMGYPHRLTLVRTFACPRGDALLVERLAHRLLAGHRQPRTEWFNAKREIVLDAVRKAGAAVEARSIKLMPADTMPKDTRAQERARQEALEWAGNQRSDLAREIRKWHETR